jgi:hypothetical protein
MKASRIADPPDNQTSSSDRCILHNLKPVKEEDSSLAVTASDFVGLEYFQCTRRPVGCGEVLYIHLTKVPQTAERPDGVDPSLSPPR